MFTRARVRIVATVTVVTLALGSLLAFAILSDGFTTRKVDLNDSGIWVTNNADGFFGRHNKSATAFDATFHPADAAQTSYSIDVTQDQSAVLGVDRARNSIYPIDVALGRALADQTAVIPPNAVVRMAGGTIAVLDPASGKLWAKRYAASARLDALDTVAGTAKPLAELGKPTAAKADLASGMDLAVGVDGIVHAASIAGKVVTIRPDGDMALAKPEVGTLTQVLTSVAISAVGANPVYLDVKKGVLLLGSAAQQSVTLPQPDATAKLATPAPDGSPVVVATSQALLTAPFAGGQLSTLASAGTGAPAVPVSVGGCTFSAWSGNPGALVRSCDGKTSEEIPLDGSKALLTPVFRVNRNAVSLNDTTNGRVFDLDTRVSILNWKDLQPPKQTDKPNKSENSPTNDPKNKPQAFPDTYGIRPGRTALLHVLDNDKSPTKTPLVIVPELDGPANRNAEAVVSPDGQTIRFTLAVDGGDSEFTYRVSNGLQMSAPARVTVGARATGDDSPPVLKTKSPALAVASGGTIPVPITGNWRDDSDNDPISLATVSPKAGTATMTADGRIEFTAPIAGARDVVQTVEYAVNDGRGKDVRGSFEVTVLGNDSTRSTAAITEPDVATGIVGRPIAVTPLANDIQGADPLNPKATLTLAAEVAPKGGVAVTTDPKTGQVLVSAPKPGTFFLEYAAAFGSAPVAKGTIRIDARPAPKNAQLPVAMPDSASIRGPGGSVLVDVLANDVDPGSALLTVQAAKAGDPDQVEVAVIRGRWLRIQPAAPSFSPNPQTVTYSVTNGTSAPVTGTVAVTMLPALEDDSPIVRPDFAVVRDSDSVLIPVLDNDSAKSGSPLTLLSNFEGAKVIGELQVDDLSVKAGEKSDAGTAYISGDQVRYVAPKKVTLPKTVLITYVAQTAGGDAKEGSIEVTINPQPKTPAEDGTPTPRPIDARALAGQTISIQVSPSGTDPDGDSTSVLGLTTAPQLGRVTGFSPTGITYEAYPTSAGTDSFSYAVVDRYGKSETSLVRVAIVPPSQPQPAVAVADSLTAAPGATVTIDPRSNDLFAKSDVVKVQIDTTKPIPGVSLADNNVVSIRAPGSGKNDKPVVVPYTLTSSGGTSTPAEITVTGQDDFQNPPRIFDQVAKLGDGKTATVEVLKTAYDPDGDSAALKVTSVGEGATVSGGAVTVPILDRVQAIPYVVSDEAGSTSAAVVYVPAAGVGGPYLKAGTKISVDEGKTVTEKVSDHVLDPRGRPVFFTTTDKMWATPRGKVTVTNDKNTGLKVTGVKGYVGPGAVVVEVTDGKDGSLTDPEGIATVVSIPVQVGPDTPVLRCPTTPVEVVQGGRVRDISVASLCSVWAPTAEMAAGLTFDASWEKAIPDVDVTGSGSKVITVDASGNALPGAMGTLSITATGTQSTPAKVTVRVVAAPKPRLAAIRLQEMQAGETRQVDIARYLTSPLKDAVPTALEARKVSGDPAEVSTSGSVVSITPGKESHGQMVFEVIVSDLADRTKTARHVRGSISFAVFSRPAAPSAPVPGKAQLDSSAVLSWAAPASNGAPILGYTVQWQPGGGTQACSASPCTIRGLQNGTTYSFKVQARNKAGESDWSPSSVGYKPDAKPGPMGPITQTAATPTSVAVSWSPVANSGSAVTYFAIVNGGAPRNVGAGTSATLSGVSAPGEPTQVSIYPENTSKMRGTPAKVTAYAATNPAMLSGAGPTMGAAASTTTVLVNIAWDPAKDNAPVKSVYSVSRDGAPLAQCQNLAATSCRDAGVDYGKAYKYSVVATTTYLGVTRNSTPLSWSITPIGTPDPWASQPVARAVNTSGGVQVDYDVPPSRGAQSLVSINLGNGWVNVPSPGRTGGPASSPTLAGTIGGGTGSIRVCNEQSSSCPQTTFGFSAYSSFTAPGVGVRSYATIACGSATASGNGWPAVLHLTGPGVDQDFPVPATGSMSTGERCGDVGNGAGFTYTATLRDTGHTGSDPARGPVSGNASGSTPNRSASIATRTADCPASVIASIGNTCNRVWITLSNFRPGSSVTCTYGGVKLKGWTATKAVDGAGNYGPFTDGFVQGTSTGSSLYDSASARYGDAEINAGCG